jgi:hypothetical protein
MLVVVEGGSACMMHWFVITRDVRFSTYGNYGCILGFPRARLRYFGSAYDFICYFAASPLAAIGLRPLGESVIGLTSPQASCGMVYPKCLPPLLYYVLSIPYLEPVMDGDGPVSFLLFRPRDELRH